MIIDIKKYYNISIVHATGSDTYVLPEKTRIIKITINNPNQLTNLSVSYCSNTNSLTPTYREVILDSDINILCKTVKVSHSDLDEADVDISLYTDIKLEDYIRDNNLIAQIMIDSNKYYLHEKFINTDFGDFFDNYLKIIGMENNE